MAGEDKMISPIPARLIINIFLGQGPWTVAQMFTWGFCGICSGILGKVSPNPHKWVLIIFGVIWGYIFGWMTNLWYWLAFVYPLTIKTYLYTNFLSLGFDTVHALSNALFMSFLGKDFIKVLQRFKQKLNYTHKVTVFDEKKGALHVSSH